MSTFALTVASTWSEARVRYVMNKVFEELLNATYAEVLTHDRACKWREDLTFLLDHQAVVTFQIQFTCRNGKMCGLGYRVSDDGTLVDDDESGGVDYHALGIAHASLVVQLRREFSHRAKVEQYLRDRGWGWGGALLEEGARDRVYSSNGYGVSRSRLGDWSDHD